MSFSWSRIFTVSQGHLKTWMRSKTTMFWTLAFPIIMMVLFGGMFSFQENKFDLYIQNHDIDDLGIPTLQSQIFMDALSATNAFNLKLVDTDKSVLDLIDKERISRILIIPNGFQVGISTGNATIFFKLDRSQTSATTVFGIVNTVVDQMNSKLINSPKIISIFQENIVSNELRFIDFFMPAVVAISIMSTGMFGAIGTNTKYRQNKVLKKLATTPLSKLEWILGMIFFQMVISVISAAIIVICGVAIFNVQVVPNIYALVVIISGALVFPGIGMVVARYVKDGESADAAGNAITLPMMFLSGTFFPLEIMPDFLQTIARVLPLTYMNEGLRDAMIFNNLDGVFFNTAVILLIGTFFIVLGSLATSWREE